jgi:hypothetical protein
MPDIDLRMVLQIAGALLCVANYVLIQLRRILATQPTSLLIVASGGIILLVSAIMGRDWGLIILEVAWLVMVATTLVVRHREARARAAAPVAPEPVAAPEPVPAAPGGLPVEAVVPDTPADVFAMEAPTVEFELVGAGDTMRA